MNSNQVTKPVRERATSLQGADMANVAGASGRYWIQQGLMVAALMALVVMTIGFVKPILMAGLFAATLYPFYLRLKPRIPSDDIRAAVLTIGFTFLFLLPLGVVVFMAANAGLKKIKSLPENWVGQFQIDPIVEKLESYLPFEHEELLRHLEQAATSAGRMALGLLQNFLADLPKLAIVNIVVLFGVFVMLVNSDRILNWFYRLSPLSQPRTERLFVTIGALSGSSVLATIASGAVQAMILGIVLAVMGFPSAFLITMSAFVLSFVPLIGTAPVSLYLVATSAIAGDWTSVTVFVFTALAVGVSDNIVRPYVLSDSAKLNAFVGFVAAIGALETMGFYGLFLGPVVAGTVLKLVELVHEERKA